MCIEPVEYVKSCKFVSKVSLIVCIGCIPTLNMTSAEGSGLQNYQLIKTLYISRICFLSLLTCMVVFFSTFANFSLQMYNYI